MRYAFTGPTDLSENDRRVVRSTMAALDEPTEVRTGGAAGLDVFASEFALQLWPHAKHRIVVPAAPYAEAAVERLLSSRPIEVAYAPKAGTPADAYRARNEAMLAEPRDGLQLIGYLRSSTFYRSGEWMTVNIAKRAGIPYVPFVLPLNRMEQANAAYERLRLLEADELLAEYQRVTGHLTGMGKQAMIAELIESELAGGEA